MGPKRKKPPKNAFSFFLDDYVENEREQGRHVSYRIAAEECGLLWKDLPEEEKEKYAQLATCYKAQVQQDKHKFTNTGISYAQVEMEQEELRVKTEQADTEIKMTISNLDSELLKTQLFYIIHCNYYCKTDAGIYVPGEIAIAEFNLEEGIRRTYHTLINPGCVPLGFAFEAKKTIEEIHGLPYPPFEEGESDYFGVLDKVLCFLEPGKLPDGRYPPLYCIENNLNASENILQALSENKCEEGDYFRVFLLHKMFFWLKNKCSECREEDIAFPVMYNAESEISKDLFCYSPGISCCYHMTSEDKYHNCSLSIVQRQAYTICDHCCQYVDVELVPGKHCSLRTDTERGARPARPERNPQRSRSPAPGEAEFDARSSFAGGFALETGQGGSFLHDEISGFGSPPPSSFSSRSGRHLPTPGFNGVPRARTPPGLGEQESDDEEDEGCKSLMPLGRGAHRF